MLHQLKILTQFMQNCDGCARQIIYKYKCTANTNTNVIANTNTDTNAEWQCFCLQIPKKVQSWKLVFSFLIWLHNITFKCDCYYWMFIWRFYVTNMYCHFCSVSLLWVYSEISIHNFPIFRENPLWKVGRAWEQLI